jgi:hypothetical protein
VLTEAERRRPWPLLPPRLPGGTSPKDHRAVIEAPSGWLKPGRRRGAASRNASGRGGSVLLLDRERDVTTLLVGWHQERRKVATRYDELAASDLGFRA